MTKLDDFSKELQQRIKSPAKRGFFDSIEANEKKLALVTAGNIEGKIYLLVQGPEGKIQDAKFLSYGQLEVIPVLDIFCESSIKSTVQEVCSLSLDQLLQNLQIENVQFNHPDFFSDLQNQLLTAVGKLDLNLYLPRTDKEKSPAPSKLLDKSGWLSLPAPKKIVYANEVLKDVLKARTVYGENTVSIYDIVSEGTEVVLSFDISIPVDKKDLMMEFIRSEFCARLYPALTVREQNRT